MKFQTYTGQDLYSSRTPRFEYLDDQRSPQELLDAIALPREWHAELAEHAAARGIHFFSSPVRPRAPSTSSRRSASPR